MSRTISRWELDEIDVSESAQGAALRVVERVTGEKDDVGTRWETAVRLAHANGASLREIAEVAGVSPQTISNLCKADPSDDLAQGRQVADELTAEAQLLEL